LALLNDKFTIGLTLSLSGRYAAMGRQAAAALEMFAADQNSAGGIDIGGRRRPLAIQCYDDRSDPKLCAELYRSLCFENRADLIFGPYSSELTRIAARIAEQAGMVMVNHGGADDGLYHKKYRLLVGVLSPAGDYFSGLAQLISQLKLWRKRVATVTFETPFARAVIGGFERECESRTMRRRGIRVTIRQSSAPTHGSGEVSIDLLLRLARRRITALVSAGSFADDVALMNGIVEAELNIPMLACVAAGVQGFADALGERADGIVGPSQWEPAVSFMPEIGPRPEPFAARMRAACGVCDYPAAQIYAAGLLSAAALRACPSLDQTPLRDAFSDLRTSTLFGDFAIDRVSGRQIGHKVLLVQWLGGKKVVIHPDAHAEPGALEFPSGWKLVLASLASLYVSLRGGPQDEEEATEEAPPED
jgi:branched-chain amino acid transport system substrate-binding protein